MVHLKKSRKDISEIRRVSTAPVIVENNGNSPNETNRSTAKVEENNKTDKDNNKMTDRDQNRPIDKDNNKTPVKHSTRISTSMKENFIEVKKDPAKDSANKENNKSSDEDTETITTTRSSNSVITINKIFSPEGEK